MKNNQVPHVILYVYNIKYVYKNITNNIKNTITHTIKLSSSMPLSGTNTILNTAML